MPVFGEQAAEGKYMHMEEAIPVLRVSDASRAVAWFARLGYEKEWDHTFEPGLPVFTSVARSGAAARSYRNIPGTRILTASSTYGSMTLTRLPKSSEWTF